MLLCIMYKADFKSKIILATYQTEFGRHNEGR